MPSAHEVKTTSLPSLRLSMDASYAGDNSYIHQCLVDLADYIVQTIEGLNRKIDQPDTMFGTPIIDLTFSHIATSTIKTNIYAKDVF